MLLGNMPHLVFNDQWVLHFVTELLRYFLAIVATLVSRNWTTSTNHITRGGHSNRLCTNTRDRGQEQGQAVKAKKIGQWSGQGTSQIRKKSRVKHS